MNLGHLRIAIWRGPNTPGASQPRTFRDGFLVRRRIKTQGVRGPSCGRSASPSWQS